MVTAFFMGKFQIVDQNRCITDQNLHSEMLMKLAIYLILHRDHSATIQELSGALWEDDEVENPTGALKNLMYRLRGQLKENLGDANYILTNRGSYCWNPEIEIVVDVEEFEKNAKKALEAEFSETERRECLRKAISYYKGEFGAKCKKTYWIMTRATYYHSLYLSSIIRLSEILMKEEDYQKLEEICGQALTLDLTDEGIHCYFVKALIFQKKFELAAAHLDEAEHILQETLGIRNSKPLEKLRQELMLLKKNDLLSMKQLVKDTVSIEENSGSFQCSYSIFKEIYRLETRRITRLGVSEQLGMITITNSCNDQITQFYVKQAMDQLEKIVSRILRAGDVFCRLNDVQIIIMLPACSQKAGEKVLKRICDSYATQFPQKEIRFSVDIKEMEAYYSRK